MIKIRGEKKSNSTDTLRRSNGNNSPKRSFRILRHLILFTLVRGSQTINQISINSGINWKTVENHITYLIGKAYVKIAFQTQYLKIYQLTDKGYSYVEFLKQRFQKTHITYVDLKGIENLKAVEKEFEDQQYSNHIRGGDLL